MQKPYGLRHRKIWIRLKTRVRDARLNTMNITAFTGPRAWLLLHRVFFQHDTFGDPKSSHALNIVKTTASMREINEDKKMEIDFLITSFVALFVIIDPIGLTPLFVALTQGMSAKARRKITIRAIGVAFFVLMLFALFGETVLGFVGISMPVFRVAGGILLFLTALDMLFQRRTKRREDQSEEEADDPSVFHLPSP